MSSATRLVLVGLGAALVLFPLGLRRPGVPMGLRADEASHYLLARSLVHDGDAAATAADLDRYFREFPYSDPVRLELGRDAGYGDDSAAADARFAVRPLYALLLVPWVAIGRADAAFALNALCFVFALALSGRHVLHARRRDDPAADDGLAWALTGGALFLSAAFVYVQWIHPASLYLLLVTVAFALGWKIAHAKSDGSRVIRPRSPRPALVAGLCMGLAAAEAPWLAALIPALLFRGRVASKLLGLAGGVILALAASWLVLGHVSPGGFAETSAFVASNPDVAPGFGDHETEGLLPAEGVGTTVRRLALALFDGRRGLLALFPFALLALLPLAVAIRRRRVALGADAWFLLAGLVVIVLSRPFDTPDGADLARYGDPLLVAAAPAVFLLLLPRIRVRGPAESLAVLATGFVAALALLPTILTPFLPPVPSGDAHHATRGGVLSLLPTGLEEVSEAGGFAPYDLGGSDGLRLWLPPWTHETRAEGFALLGGVRAEGWLEIPDETGAAPTDASGVHLLLRNFAPRNRVDVALGGDREEIHFPGDEPPESTRIRLAPGEMREARRRSDRASVRLARLNVETSTGEKPFWRTGIHRDHYTGVELFVLGTDAHLERDVFAVEWLGCGAPSRLAPGEDARVLVRLRNVSDETWHADGTARVRLGHRWRSGDRVVQSPGRAELPGDVPPGDVALAWVGVRAPGEPGEWDLEIEPIYEWVAWFSDRTDGALCTVGIDVGS